MLNVLIILLCIILYGYAEGVFPYHKKLDHWGIKFMPELLLSALVSYAWWPILGLYSLACGLWFYFGIQSGTWIMLPWWKEGVRSTTRESSLMIISEPLRKALQLDFDSEAHSWMYAALRGFISTLPIGGLGLIYEPLCREIGSHFNHTVTALLMGACYGLNIYAITLL